MEITICKLCGEEKKNMGVHLKHKHQMTQEQYNALMSETDEMTNELESVPIPEEAKSEPSLTGAVEGGPKVEVSEDTPEPSSVEINENMTVGEYCSVKNMDFDELNKLVNRTNIGEPEDAVTIAEKRKRAGVEESEELLDQNIVETSDLSVAEALCEVHKTHECVTVRSGPPKIYVLNRKA